MAPSERPRKLTPAEEKKYTEAAKAASDRLEAQRERERQLDREGK